MARPARSLSIQQGGPGVPALRQLLVCAEFAVANVERLVIDEQPEYLAIGDIDH